MALNIKLNNFEFGVGDKIRVIQEIIEGEKKRLQTFEGIVISIRGSLKEKTFTIRKIGEGQIGIEKIYPSSLKTIKDIKIIKKGTQGVNRSKLYYIRNKSKKEIDKIYSRASNKLK